MIIGLLPRPDDAAVCLSNLAEEDFAKAAISVVMNTPADAAALADVAGPLNALPLDDLPGRLTALGLSPAAAAAYRDGVRGGGVFIAVSAGAGAADDAAQETLGDHRGRLIRRVPDPPAARQE